MNPHIQHLIACVKVWDEAGAPRPVAIKREAMAVQEQIDEMQKVWKDICEKSTVVLNADGKQLLIKEADLIRIGACLGL